MNESFKAYDAHQDAIRKIQSGRPAKMSVTVVQTERGYLVFSDSLQGQHGLRLYLQHLADHFHHPGSDGLTKLKIYQFHTERKELMELADKCYLGRGLPFDKKDYNFLHGLSGQPEYINRINPVVEYDMRPTINNLERFVGENMLELSERNYNILTLQNIAESGYHPMAITDSFSHLKEFSDIEKTLRKVDQAKSISNYYPYEKERGIVQEQAKQKAEYLLDNVVKARKDTSDQSLGKSISSNKTLSVRQKRNLSGSLLRQPSETSPKKDKQTIQPHKKKSPVQKIK